MSDATQPRTIPVGILVSVTESSSRKRAQRIIRRPRKPVSPVPRRSPLPWHEMLAGVSAVGLVLVVGVALWAGNSPPPAHVPAAIVAMERVIAPVAVVPAPPVVEPADLAANVPEPEPRPLLDRLPSVPTPVAMPMPAQPETDLTPEPKLEPAVPPAPPKVCTRKLGTRIDFVAEPPEAFKRAKAENKLVFMIHLSGNFEDQEFT